MTDPDSTDQPEPRQARRRRSAARAPADVLDPGETPTGTPRSKSRLMPLVLIANGWIAAGTVAAILVIVFLIGLVFTH